MQSRRNFLKSSAATAAMLSLGFQTAAEAQEPKDTITFTLTNGVATQGKATNGDPIVMRENTRYTVPITPNGLIRTPAEVIPKKHQTPAILQRFEGHAIILPNSNNQLYLPKGTIVEEPGKPAFKFRFDVPLSFKTNPTFLHVIPYKSDIANLRSQKLDAQRLVPVDLDSLKVILDTNGRRDYALNARQQAGITTAFILQYDVNNALGLTESQLKALERQKKNPSTDPELIDFYKEHIRMHHGVPEGVTIFGANVARILIAEELRNRPSPQGTQPQ